MIRSSSFSGGQPPANKPFSFGGTGSTAAPSTSTTGGGFSFGAPSTTNNAGSAQAPGTGTGAATGGFSFGGNNPSSQQQSQPQQQQQQTSNTGGGFSFGAPAATSNTSTGGGLFGQSKPAGTTGFSFGQPVQATGNTGATNSTGGGLFGAANSTTGGGSGLFGTGTAQPATTSGNAGGLFGGSTSLFGGQAQQPQAQPPQQQSAILSHPYYQRERFNDLGDDQRKLLEEFQKHITSQTNLRDELTAKLVPSSSSASNLSILGQEIASLYSNLKYATTSLSTMSSSLESELGNVRRLAEAVETDRQDFVNLWEIGSAFRENQLGGGSNPAGPSAGPHDPSSAFSASTNDPNNHLRRSGGLEVRRDFLINYLSKQAADFTSKILRYRSTISQIERHLSSLSSRDSHSPQAISDVIHFQHTTFMHLANQVASIHSEVEVLKRDYRQWYAKSFRSARDPFEMTDLVGTL